MIWGAISPSTGWLRKLERLRLPPSQLNFIERLDDEAIGVEKEAKNRYYEEKFNTHKELTQFKDEIKRELGEEWIKERKLEYLEPKLERLNKRIKSIHKYYTDATEREVPYWIKSVLVEIEGLADLEKERKKIDTQIYFLKHSDKIGNQITQEDIVRARDYPFENLIEANRAKFAICPFHSDSHPSLWIKNNFGHCFSCGKSVDTIQFIIETKEMSFVEAVKYLNGL